MSTTLFDLSDLNASNGFAIQGLDDFDNLGRSVSSAGDINGDGIDDLIIAAPYADYTGNYSAEGAAYVVFGSAGGFDATFDVSNLNTSNGFVITGIDDFDNLGRSVSSAGDINGDGIDDLIIGAPFAEPDDSYSSQGIAYVVFGFTSLDLIGTAEDDVLVGEGGDDFISGLDGSDILIGQGGNDEIFGGNGDDFIDAGGGNDVVDGGNSGDDRIIGGAGDDSLSGGRGLDVIEGGSGNDTINGGSGKDRLEGGSGNDTINGGNGKDIIEGGSGNDTINGGSNQDLIFGDTGDDNISGGGGNDTINGASGNDELFGNNGNDLIFGDTGDDFIDGGNNNDEINGSFGDDNIIGGRGADQLIGGVGNDTLDGGGGNDLLIGIDISNPLVAGISEIDVLTGGSGRDIFVLAEAGSLFYDDGDSLSAGEEDLAIITDFNPNQDFIQLLGSEQSYTLDFFNTVAGSIDATLSFNVPGETSEQIALLQDVSSDLSLSDSAFIFV